MATKTCGPITISIDGKEVCRFIAGDIIVNESNDGQGKNKKSYYQKKPKKVLVEDCAYLDGVRNELLQKYTNLANVYQADKIKLAKLENENHSLRVSVKELSGIISRTTLL